LAEFRNDPNDSYMVVMFADRFMLQAMTGKRSPAIAMVMDVLIFTVPLI